MAIEYDLVIIGGSWEGRYAASLAASRQARVALIEPRPPLYPDLYEQTLGYWSDFATQSQEVAAAGLLQSGSALNLTGAIAWAKEVQQSVSPELSPPQLSALGVDYVGETGVFQSKPHLTFCTQNRILRSRSYLLCLPTQPQPTPPSLENPTQTPYLTPSDLWTPSTLHELPPHLIIVGGTPRALSLAQTLQRLGKQITLVLEHRLLPTEDFDLVQYFQAQLEALGMQIITQSPVSQIRLIAEKKWVQAGTKAICADEIIWAIGDEPQTTGLNLEGVGVQVNKRGIGVNEKLQTSNPKIYACGSSLGGYSNLQIAQYEAQIALKNALYFPVFLSNYTLLPYHLALSPALGRVGLTERQARQYYGENILVLKQNFQGNSLALIRNQTTGFIKLITHPDGEILGGHILGFQAGELIQMLSLALQHQIKLPQLSQSFAIPDSFSGVFSSLIQAWQQEQFSQPSLIHSWRKSWFNG